MAMATPVRLASRASSSSSALTAAGLLIVIQENIARRRHHARGPRRRHGPAVRPGAGIEEEQVPRPQGRHHRRQRRGVGGEAAAFMIVDADQAGHPRQIPAQAPRDLVRRPCRASAPSARDRAPPAPPSAHAPAPDGPCARRPPPGTAWSRHRAGRTAPPPCGSAIALSVPARSSPRSSMQMAITGRGGPEPPHAHRAARAAARCASRRSPAVSQSRQRRCPRPDKAPAARSGCSRQKPRGTAKRTTPWAPALDIGLRAPCPAARHRASAEWPASAAPPPNTSAAAEQQGEGKLRQAPNQ